MYGGFEALRAIFRNKLYRARRYDLSIVVAIISLLTVFSLLMGLISFSRMLGGKDVEAQEVSLRGQLLDFLLATSREPDGSSILDNPVDFNSIRRPLGFVRLQRPFFSYFLTRENAKTFRLSNVRIDVPRSCQVEFPLGEEKLTDLTPRDEFQLVRLCFAVVPDDSAGSYAYFAIRYPSTGLSPHRRGGPLTGDVVTLSFQRGSKPPVTIATVFEKPSGYPVTRKFPGRYDGVYDLAGFVASDAGRPTSLLNGQAIERFEEEYGKQMTTVIGRFDQALLGAQEDGPYGRIPELRATRIAVTLTRNDGMNLSIDPDRLGKAATSLEQAYQAAVPSRAKVDISLLSGNGPAVRWWPLAIPEDKTLKESPTLIQSIGQWITARIATIKDTTVERQLTIGGRPAVAKLTLTSESIPPLAVGMAGWMGLAMFCLLFLILISLGSYIRVYRITRWTYSLGLKRNAEADDDSIAKLKRLVEGRKDQVGALAQVFLNYVLWHREANVEKTRALELRAQDIKANEETLYIIGHQIRSPLESLSNLSGLPDTANNLIRQMKKTFELLAAWRNVEQVIQERKFDITIDDLSSKLHIYAESQRNQNRPVSFERPSFEALIAVDWDFLEQILDQLIDNAFSLGPPGVHVEISLMLDGTSAIISVANDGTRFDDSISPFKLGQSTRKRGKHGGIGLYMVRRFSEAFNGQVDAKNTEAGVVVVIQFPLANPNRKA